MSWFTRKSDEQKLADVSKAADRVELSGDPSRIMRKGLLFLVLGLGGLVAWSVFAKLDEAVPAPGAVSILSQRKTVQHPGGGVVSKVLVREAQEVKEGDVLVEMVDTQTRANYDALQYEWYSLKATEARLMAEKTGAREIRFDPALLDAQKNPYGNAKAAAEFMALQTQLFQTRRASLESELSVLDQNRAGIEAQTRGLRAQLGGRTAQLDLVTRQLKDSRSLAQEGYLPRNRLFEEERTAAELNSQSLDIQANISRLASAQMELSARREQRLREFARDVDTQMAQTAAQLSTSSERIRSAEVDLERTRVRAPVTGQVVQLQVQTSGAVLNPGAHLMDIVPRDEQLILEAQVPLQMVDRIAAGMPADIRFHGFTDFQHLNVDGTVLSVSGDRLVDANTHAAYYLARVAVTPEGLKELGHRVLVPGMPADVMIRVGERSAFRYLTDPLRKRLSASMTEH